MWEILQIYILVVITGLCLTGMLISWQEETAKENPHKEDYYIAKTLMGLTSSPLLIPLLLIYAAIVLISLPIAGLQKIKEKTPPFIKDILNFFYDAKWHVTIAIILASIPLLHLAIQHHNQTAPDATNSSTYQTTEAKRYWITNSTRKTHNSSCRYYANSRGYYSSYGTGNNCRICGGEYGG